MKKYSLKKKMISVLILTAMLITSSVQTALASDTGAIENGDSEEMIMLMNVEPVEENPLMVLNENGYFAESFCRKLNLEDSLEWSNAASGFMEGLSDEAMDVLNAASTIGDVYEYASLTFYPDGSVKQSYKIKDEIYNAFSENIWFKLVINQSVDNESTYTVNKEQGIITLGDGSTVFTMDVVNAIFTWNFIADNERFMIAGETVENPQNPIPGGENPQEPVEEDSLMTLNDEGYFAQSFCRTLDMEDTLVWSNMTLLFYVNLTKDALDVVNQAKKMGDIYEYASITFYPNGSMKQTYKIKDEIYQAFSERELFVSLIPQTRELESTYIVDKSQGAIILEDGSSIAMDVTDASFTRDFLANGEHFVLPGEVVGSGSEITKNYTIMNNISYGEDVRNTMDVFIPNSLDTTKENGAFILIYGGSWTSGNKEDNWTLAQQYAEAGYIAVAINMRNCTYDDETQKTLTTVYDMLNDVQGSVKKLKALSDENGWNVTQCATKGFSSGANVAMLYAYSRGSGVPYFDTDEILPVRFVADVVGPVDMHDSAWGSDEEWPEEDRTLMTQPGAGPAYAMLLTGAANKGELSEEELEECINSMSPVWYVENFGGLPTVIGYSQRDIIQSPANGRRLQRYLDEKGVRSDLYTFPNSIHSYAGDPELAQEYFDKTIEYAQTYFVSGAEEPEKPADSTNPDNSGSESGTYEMIEGANGTITVNGNDSTAIFRANIDFDKFDGVLVDGNVVNPSNYTAWEGSTYVQLHSDFLKTLSAGEHELAILANDGGKAETKFIVVANNMSNSSTNNQNDDSTITTPLKTSPKTGDEVFPVYVAMLLLLLSIVMMGYAVTKYKNN